MFFISESEYSSFRYIGGPTYSISKEVNVSAGYSQMFGTETLQAIKGGNYQNTQNWAWLMFTFTPTFFKSEK
jgi:hypothetical protein